MLVLISVLETGFVGLHEFHANPLLLINNANFNAN